MLTRAVMAQALPPSPPKIVDDEPTGGLERRFDALLLKLGAQGMEGS